MYVAWIYEALSPCDYVKHMRGDCSVVKEEPKKRTCECAVAVSRVMYNANNPQIPKVNV